VVSEVPSERNIFTLNSAIAGVSESNFGRLGAEQQGGYVTGNARSQLDPSLWEMPGAMPEIVPGGDFGANIDRLFTERSMVMQAWSAYGCSGRLSTSGSACRPNWVAAGLRWCRNCLPGRPRRRPTRSSWACSPSMRLPHQGSTYTTTVTRHGRIDLRIGAVFPDGATVASATLNGSPVKLMLVKTTRGLEALAKAEPGQRTATLVSTIAP